MKGAHMGTQAETILQQLKMLQTKPPLTGPELAKALKVYTPADLVERCDELGAREFLVEDLIPKQSLGIIVGNSGTGKTPLIYQLGMCIAAGIPFLGHKVKQGRVLYMDYENGLEQVKDMLN